MTQVLKRVHPFQFAKLFAIICGFFYLLCLPSTLIKSLPLSSSLNEKSSLVYQVLKALLNSISFVELIMCPILGFIIGYFLASIYNFSARWVGGIEIEVDNKN